MKTCDNSTPPWFVGHWRDWHRGHGCDQDDGRPRSEAAQTEVAQHAQNGASGFLTDADLGFLRASTTSGNTLLVRALDELAARRAGASVTRHFDHSGRTTKHFDRLLGTCVCRDCEKLPSFEREVADAVISEPKEPA